MLMEKQKNETSPCYVYEERMPWNAVEKVIMERRSIRKYKKKPLPDALIKRILESARFAPSTGNQQPWKFVVIKSPEIIAQMEKDAGLVAKFFMFFFNYTDSKGIMRMIRKFLAHTFAFRLFSGELHPAPFVAMVEASKGRTSFWHNAPVVILILEDKRGVSNPAVDVGVAGQNMVIAAHSLGVGTCWVGFCKLLMYLPKWKKIFGVKYPYRLRESITFGWPASKANGEVVREVMLVDWFEKGLKDPSRTERQGE